MSYYQLIAYFFFLFPTTAGWAVGCQIRQDLELKRGTRHRYRHFLLLNPAGRRPPKLQHHELRLRSTSPKGHYHDGHLLLTKTDFSGHQKSARNGVSSLSLASGQVRLISSWAHWRPPTQSSADPSQSPKLGTIHPKRRELVRKMAPTVSDHLVRGPKAGIHLS